MAFHLAIKEIWRTRGRFILFSGVIALITMLVLFVAALAEGLGSGNRQYIEKLNADLVVYQSNVDLSAAASRIGVSGLNKIRRVDGVKAVGPVGAASVALVSPLKAGADSLNVALIGVEPGLPGEPPAFEGRQLEGRQSREAVLDRNVALRTGLKVGDVLTIKSIQDTQEQFYELRVVGISDGRQYSLQPSIIIPFRTWEELRPQAVIGGTPGAELVANIVAVQLENPADREMMAQRIEDEVRNVEAVDTVTAYKATPGYSAAAEHIGHAALFRPADRHPGHRRLLPDPDPAEGGPNWHAQGDRRTEFGHRRRGDPADHCGDGCGCCSGRGAVAGTVAWLPAPGADYLLALRSCGGSRLAAAHWPRRRACVGALFVEG